MNFIYQTIEAMGCKHQWEAIMEWDEEDFKELIKLLLDMPRINKDRFIKSIYRCKHCKVTKTIETKVW